MIDFSTDKSQRLANYTKELFDKQQSERVLFSNNNKVFNICNAFIYIMFFVNILFYLALFMGSLILFLDNGQMRELLSGHAISTLLLITGIIVYKFKSKFTGAIFMLISTVTRYFSVYSGENSNPFAFSVTKQGVQAAATVEAKFFMHYLPMVVLFVLCLYVAVTEFVSKKRFEKLYNSVCDTVFSLKGDSSDFADEQEWEECIDRFLSGEYKNFKKPKKSLRKKAEKEKSKKI